MQCTPADRTIRQSPKKEGAHASRHSSLCGAQALLGASRQTLIQKQKKVEMAVVA
jgi:hypothetical protein